MRMSIRRRTRKRSINKKHNRKSRIFKKNRNNKEYVGGGGGCSKMATVVPHSGFGHHTWWKQTDIPTGTGYRWEKYNDEDTTWLNNEYVGYWLDTGSGSRHPSHHDTPDRQFVLKEGTDFMFDFQELLQIRMTNGAANKIMFTEGITPPSPSDARLDRVLPHAGIAGFRDPNDIYVTHPWNKIIGSALQFAKSRGVARILSDDGIEEFIKTDRAPPMGYNDRFGYCRGRSPPPPSPLGQGCRPQLQHAKQDNRQSADYLEYQLPGEVFTMDPSPIYTSGDPPPPSTTPEQRQRQRPRRVKHHDGQSCASLASPLASPLRRTNVSWRTWQNIPSMTQHNTNPNRARYLIPRTRLW